MKKILRFFKSNIFGIILSAAIGAMVAIILDFNPLLSAIGFLAGYFVVGVIVEVASSHFTIKRTRENALKTDEKVKNRTLGSIKVDFITEIKDEED